MHHLPPVIAMLGTFGTLVTFIYMRYKSRHTERMALIESGQSADILNEKTLSSGEGGLKTGLFLIGGGLGFFIGKIVETALHWEEGSGIFPLALVGAGIGLVIFYSIVRRNKLNDGF